MYERNTAGPLFATAMVALGVLNGFNIGRAITENSEQNTADDRVERVQTYNEHLRGQLTEITPGVIGRLVVKDQDDSFSFQTQTGQGKAETCSGEYEVKDDIAIAVGELACTQTSPIGK